MALILFRVKAEVLTGAHNLLHSATSSGNPSPTLPPSLAPPIVLLGYLQTPGVLPPQGLALAVSSVCNPHGSIISFKSNF